MDMGLKNRVVLVTGSSSGIGRAIAVAFGREGARVVITYHTNQTSAEQTVEKVQEVGGDSLILPFDLENDTSIQTAIQQILKHWGTIDVLVNNAIQWAHRGKPIGAPNFEDVAPEQWRRMMRTALEGTYYTTQAVLPSMRSSGWGRIINISSNLAEDGLPGAGAYAAAKAGLHGLTRTLAVELAPIGILCNAVMPGMTLTERARRVLPDYVRQQVANETPTGRLTTPEDVANMVVADFYSHIDHHTLPPISAFEIRLVVERTQLAPFHI